MRFDEHSLTEQNGNIIIKAFHSSVLPEKRVYNAHHHTECELSLFVSGSGIYSVSGKDYTFAPGDMFLFGSNEPHCITEINEKLNLLNIHFEPRILWENPDTSELLALFNNRTADFSNKFPSSDSNLKNYILQTEQEIKSSAISSNLQTKLLIYSALIHIIRKYNAVAESTVQSNIPAENLKEAIVFINNNLDKPITLNSIAEISCLTPTYFSAVFKKYNGVSPWDYIKIKRVERAIELLKTTKLSKLEIAEKCGFNSSSNFYKIFSSVTGKKPGDYRSK